MVCNYYLRTKDKEEIEYLIQCAADADSDLQAVQYFYNLDTNNITEIVDYLESIGYMVSYSKRYEKGDIGIGQINLEIKRGNWNDS